MTKRYAILQKKLQELESTLALLFSCNFPVDTTPRRHQLLLSDDGAAAATIDQQFVFLRNLLSAEISSHPSKPHHLAHISLRLDQLEAAFRDWVEVKHHNITTDYSTLDRVEAASTCSCTESCLYDDGEGEEEEEEDGREEPEIFYETVVEEKAEPVETARMGDAKREEEERGRVFWRYLGVWGGGVMVGAVLMGFVMVRFCGCFHYNIEQEGFLIPT